MKKLALLLVAVSLVSVFSPASAGMVMKRLGTDPAGDGPPALDVTYLEVGGHHGKMLEIRIGVEGMLPGLAGYPELPGIEWTFESAGRTFIAEGAIQGGEPSFYLFELKDGSFTQLETPEGTYDAADGYISIHVPYKNIGARSGMKISGVGPKGTEDVDAHVHAGATDHYPDYLATTKDFVLP